jgi:hypothetical protein
MAVGRRCRRRRQLVAEVGCEGACLPVVRGGSSWNELVRESLGSDQLRNFGVISKSNLVLGTTHILEPNHFTLKNGERRTAKQTAEAGA